jgi:putative transposase
VIRRLALVQAADADPSLRRQCELLGVPRSHYYYTPCPETPENLKLMKRLDALHLEWPEFGRPKLTYQLRREGWAINEKRVGRLMRVMGLEAIYPKPGTSQRAAGHEIYPYLLRGKDISGPDQVWCADITYIPMRHGWWR